jgi:hypothetical protein
MAKAIDPPPSEAKGNVKGAVSAAIAVSFVVTLAISMAFRITLGKGLDKGIAVVAAASFLLTFGAILLVRHLRGSK